jgi:type II secretory pathway component PulJ
MNRKQRLRGHTLIEILIACMIMTLLGVGLWTLLRSTYNSQYEVLGQNSANSYSRQAIDEIADNLRGAKAVTTATASEIIFTDNSNVPVRYWISGSSLRKTTNGLPAGGSVVVRDVQALSFNYWSYYNGVWLSSALPSNVANVKAVDFTATSTVNGSTRQTSGSVRIRQLQ